MIIVPIAWTNVNWESFVTKCNVHIGRSPTRALDSKGSPVGYLDSFLSALNEFSFKNAFTLNEGVLHHVSLTFLMVSDYQDFYDLLENSYKKLTFLKCDDYLQKNKSAYIVSGTLKDWKDCIIDNNSEFSYEMWNMLHGMGFGQVFTEYKINNKKQIERRI